MAMKEQVAAPKADGVGPAEVVKRLGMARSCVYRGLEALEGRKAREKGKGLAPPPTSTSRKSFQGVSARGPRLMFGPPKQFDHLVCIPTDKCSWENR